MYELKIHLCEKIKLSDTNTFFDVISWLNLRRIGNKSKIGKYVLGEAEKYPGKEKYGRNDVHLFETNGETRIFEDAYGQALWEIDPHILLALLKESHKEAPYRRYGLTIVCLQNFIKYFKEENITIVCEGQ